MTATKTEIKTTRLTGFFFSIAMYQAPDGTWPTYTLYMRHHSHSLCPHTQSIDNITPTLCMTSHSPYVWHLLPYTNHHILILWHQTSMFMSSQPLYFTSCPLYLYHHIHSIDDITTICISEIISAIVHNIISIVYEMTPTVCHHNHCFHGMISLKGKVLTSRTRAGRLMSSSLRASVFKRSHLLVSEREQGGDAWT